MKHGSLTNVLYAQAKGVAGTEMAVGVGATVVHWTDREPATVIWISKSGKTARIQYDDAKRTDNRGWSDQQEYEYTRNENGRIETIYLSKSGHWKMRGCGTAVLIGSREKYYDFSF